jgi:hypothetical protein
MFMIVATFIPSDTGATLAKTRYRRKVTQVGPGIRLIRVLDTLGPNRIKVLSIDPASRVTIDTVLSNNLLTGFETTSSMSRRRDAIAAINGDFALPWGRPPHVFAEDGQLKGTPIPWGRAFAISRDEANAYFGHPSVLVSVADARTEGKWRVQLWNERRPRASEIAAYTDAVGGYLRPPRAACSARLYRASGMRWGSSSRIGVVRDYRVDAVRCMWHRMRLRRGIVLSARRGSSRAADVKGLRRGDIVALKWRVGWPGVLDVIGGNPTLLEDGRITVGECPRSAYFCRRHPRTGVGVRANGRILLVVVDGRRPGSIGMTPAQFARLFKRLRATSALNLDGGGSTTMVVRERVINRPSDVTGERAVSSALLVLGGPDRREPEPQPFSTLPSLAELVDPFAMGTRDDNAARLAKEMGAGRAATLDPASLGGLLDALSKGAFDYGSVRLSSGLRSIVTRFRNR